MNRALLETGGPPPTPGEQAGAEPTQGGTQSPVLQLGAEMLRAFMQDPSEDNRVALITVARGIQQVLEQAGGMGGQARPPEAAPGGAAEQAPPPQM